MSRPHDHPERNHEAGSGVRIRGLAKRFGTVQALGGVDLDIAPGEVVALLGPNGAGKSTIMRILGTTVLPDDGTVEVAGHDVVAEPAAARAATGLVLGEERAWYWRLTGHQNLTFLAALHGQRKAAAAATATDLLARMGLADAADRRVEGYSSGMRSRLALARALMGDPPVLLLDEPTRALDPVAAIEFRHQALDLASEGRTVLYATHDLHEAAAVADRVTVLSAGQVVATRAKGASAADLEALLVELSER